MEGFTIVERLPLKLMPQSGHRGLLRDDRRQEKVSLEYKSEGELNTKNAVN